MIGQTLRQYQITEQLGAGGMGVVWKARDTTLDRDVALKILPFDVADDEERRERFLREAKAASALNHPNIITTYEINSDRGIPYIAMEYVNGETLARRLERGPLTIDESIRVATQIADGVGRAHREGIVHRDLKPGNIMITSDGLVKVVDFGLAKVQQPVGGLQNSELMTQLALTQAGVMIGTIGFMSPEQSVGDAVDARSDVFSFGVLLYVMLTHTLPFTGDSRMEMLRRLHLSDPVRLESIQPDTPPRLASIVRRALEKRPEDRYANLSDVASELRGLTAELTAASFTPRPFRWRGIPQPVSSRPGVRVGLAVALLVVLIASAWIYRDTVVRPFFNFTRGVSSVANAGPYELSQQAALLLARDDKERNVDRAIELLERALMLDNRYALAQAYLATAYLRRHVTSPDPQWLRLARETAGQALEANPDLAVGHTALGYVQLRSEDTDRGEASFRRAAELDPTSPQPYVGLGMSLASRGRDTQAEAAFRRAIELGPQDWRPHIEFGQFFYARARYAEAVKEWEAVRQLTPDNSLVLRNLGAAYYQLGRVDEAASTLQRSLEIQPSAPTYTNLGTIRFFQGRYTEAVDAFERAVKLGANRYLNWGNLGDGYRWAPGRRAEAVAAYRRAVALLQEQIAQHPDDADLRTRRAVYLAKVGDLKTAVNDVDGIDSRTKLTAQMWYRLTLVYELAGNRPKTLSSLEQALRAGYPVSELNNEPELTALRNTVDYQRLVGQFTTR